MALVLSVIEVSGLRNLRTIQVRLACWLPRNGTGTVSVNDMSLVCVTLGRFQPDLPVGCLEMALVL